MNPEKTLIFQHLHRTGGTNIAHILGRYFGREHVHIVNQLADLPEVSFEYFKNMPQKERDKIQLLHGHMPFGLHEYFSHPCDYITVLRDPVERIISEYTFLNSKKNIPTRVKNYELLRGSSLEEFVRSDFDSVNDYAVRIYSGKWREPYQRVVPLSRADLETAKQNLVRYFRVVGVTERLDETIVVLAKKFGWRRPYYLRNMRVMKRDYEVTEDIQKIVRKKNALDYELYAFANAMLDASIKEYGKVFFVDRIAFSALNKLLGYASVLADIVPASWCKQARRLLWAQE